MTATTDLEAQVRLLKLEIAVSQIWTLLASVINKEQFNRLNVIRQKEITLLEARLDAVETQVNTLQDAYNNLL